MEISDEDVRIKETDNMDKTRSSVLQKTESFNAERMQKNKDGTEVAQEQKKPHSSSCKKKNFSRSQSVSMPKTPTQKLDTNYSYKCTSKLSSLSNMSDEDLENWKQSMMESKDSCAETKPKEPILTVASSMTGNSSVTIGFNVQDEKKEKPDL